MDKKAIKEGNQALLKLMLSLSEASNWERTLAMTEDSLRLLQNEDWLSEVDTVYAVGHGTSLCTALNAEAWFAHISKLRAQALPAFQFSRYSDDYLLRPEKTLVIGVTCSGNTVSVAQCLEIANAKGAVTICLSGDSDGLNCVNAARYRIKADVGIEKRSNVKVAAHSISHIFLLAGAYKLAVLLGRRNGSLDAAGVDYWQKQFEDVIGSMKHLPSLYERTCQASAAMIGIGARNFAVLGTGPNIGTMKEGALKISEFCWTFGAGEELEDFIHGRFRELDDKVPLLIISPAGKPYEKTMDALAGCSMAGTPSIVFSDEITLAMKKLATYAIKMPNIKDEYLTPFLYIFPLWFYGYHIRETEGELVGEARHNLLAAKIKFKDNFNELGERIT